MWDLVIDFFSGAGDFVTDVASGAAGAVSTFGDWVGGLFEGGSTAASVASEAADGGKSVAEGVSGLAVDSVDTKSLAEQVNSGEGIFADAAQAAGKTAAAAKPGAIAEWWDKLDPKSKAEIYKTVGGGALAGLGAMGAASIKGGQDRELLDRRYELEADLMRQKQAMNKVPAGVPFKPKKGALLSNQMGQPVYNPNNPLAPRPGLIFGGMNG